VDKTEVQVMKEIMQAIAQALKTGQTIALVTVLRSMGSTPRHAAAKMVVQADGSFVGTIGGGSMEHKAIRDAQTAIARRETCLIKYPLIGKTPQSLGLCGGTQEVFIDILAAQAGNGYPDERLNLFETIIADCDAGEPVGLVTVVRSEDKMAWPVGQKALVRYDASTQGELGRGELGARALMAAQRALEQNRSVLLGYQPGDDTFKVLDSATQASIELFVDIVQPGLELLIIGTGHIGLALAQFGRIMGMRVTVVDDRPEWIERFPEADERLFVSYDPGTERLEAIPVTITPSTCIVVATWGWDEPALEQVATSPAAYIGLVASRRKAKIIFDGLLARGVSQEDLARVRAPAGLHLGAETPEEIALSIMAEILLLQRGATARPMLEIKGHPLTLATGRA
jgi:xanthine dehydrogenase accessory factor